MYSFTEWCAEGASIALGGFSIILIIFWFMLIAGVSLLVIGAVGWFFTREKRPRKTQPVQEAPAERTLDRDSGSTRGVSR